MTDKSAAGLKVDPELIAYWKAAPKHSNEYLAAELLESTLRELADCKAELERSKEALLLTFDYVYDWPNNFYRCSVCGASYHYHAKDCLVDKVLGGLQYERLKRR